MTRVSLPRGSLFAWPRLFAGGELAVIQQDVITVDVDSADTDAFHIDQFIHVFIWAVFTPVVNDCLGFAKTDTLE